VKRGTVIALIILLLAGGVAAGWYFWDKNYNQPTTNNTQTNKQTDPSEGGKYLYIKEWSVRFKLPDSLRSDIYYVIETLRSESGTAVDSEAARLASHSLDNLPGSNCKLIINEQKSVYGGMQLTISRSKDKLASDVLPSYTDANRQLGDGYYYSLSYGHASCADSPEAEQRQIEIIQQLIEPFKKMEVAV